MSESPSSAKLQANPKPSNAAYVPGWFPTLAFCFTILCITVGGCTFAAYYCGLTWRYPPDFYFLEWFLCSFAFVPLWAVVVNWKALKTLAVIFTVILSIYLVLFVSRERNPYLSGLAEAVRHTDLQPLRQWAEAHVPPTAGPFTTVSPDTESIPEAVWRSLPYKDIKPYFRFFSLSGDGDWMLKVDHVGGGFMPHNGLILTLGRDVDPSTTDWVRRTRFVAPHVWVFLGGW